jgi:two-component system, chemotaxis family, CheB/CheR fusion protein
MAPKKKATPGRRSPSATRESGAAAGTPDAGRPAKRGGKPTASDHGRADASFPIVGIGGSAGALPALRDLLAHLPTDGGMAFVVLTHQAPKAPSFLAEILGKCTEMAVRELTDGTRVEPDRVYVAPPGRYVTIEKGVLGVEEAIERGHPPLPIDSFFRSLARDREDLAVGIVLSGTGADGTLGLQAIRAESGLTLAQSPRTAEFDGMPSSAVAAGVVDLVLPTAEMPAHLLAHARGVTSRPRVREASEVVSAELERIVALIRVRTSQDFSPYKRGTLLRRVERRMAMHSIGRVAEYARYLEEHEEEIDALWRDWLIGVSRFFREPEVFEALAQSGLPEILS